MNNHQNKETLDVFKYQLQEEQEDGIQVSSEDFLLLEIVQK